MKKPRQEKRLYVQVEQTGGGKCRYVGGRGFRVRLVVGEAWPGEALPEDKLKELRAVTRKLRALPREGFEP